MRRIVATTFVAWLLLSACTAPQEPATVDDRRDTVIAWLDGQAVDPDVFAPSFTAQVSADEMEDLLDGLRPFAPWELGEERSRSASGLTTTLEGSDGTVLVLSFSLDARGRFDSLLFRPDVDLTLDDPPASVVEAIERLETHGAVALQLARVEDGECRPTLVHGSTDPVPVGSVFKLWVLGAVVEAVAAGQLAWDEELTLQEADLSLPSGVLQSRPVGTTVTVREAADLMIRISDNTATDLLIRTVGRAAVEDVQAHMGHATPSVNVPFPTTREFFVIKADPARRTAWIEADADRRRTILDDVRDAALPDVTAFVGETLDPDLVEWFASTADTCRALAWLLDRTDDDDQEPLRGILTTNPGVPDLNGRWDEIAWKGGSEPGLLAAAWAVTDDDATHVLTASVLDADAVLDDQTVVLLLAAIRDLLP